MYVPIDLSSPSPADGNYFLVAPRNKTFVLGKGRYHPFAPFWRAASWIMLIYFCAGWLYLGGLPAIRSILYLTTNIPTTATIQKLEALTDSKKSTSFYVTYHWGITEGFSDEKYIPEELYTEWHVAGLYPYQAA